MTLPIYLISAFLFIIAALVIFRIFARRDYKRKGRLTLFSSILEWLIFFSWGTFTWIDIRSGLPPSRVSPILNGIGLFMILFGLIVLFILIAKFGLSRACGLEVNVLKQSGLYRFTRNPQIIACGLAVIGYALLWLSWHTLGWVVIYATIAHIMVLTEEEHLRNIHGDEYVKYCERVPRYIGFRRSS